jgi:hypothetical protein
MLWYCRVRSAINAAMPFLAPTQATNLALLVSAILKKQTLCLSELARTYPTPEKRRVPAPKHELLHRLKRLWRFTNNERVDPLEVQMALVPYTTIACLGFPRFLGLAIDWTMFETTLPSGKQMRYPRSCASPSLVRGGRCRCCRWPMIGTTSVQTRARTNFLSRTPF